VLADFLNGLMMKVGEKGRGFILRIRGYICFPRMLGPIAGRDCRGMCGAGEGLADAFVKRGSLWLGGGDNDDKQDGRGAPQTLNEGLLSYPSARAVRRRWRLGLSHLGRLGGQGPIQAHQQALGLMAFESVLIHQV
jgi:hypothetical protein